MGNILHNDALPNETKLKAATVTSEMITRVRDQCMEVTDGFTLFFHPNIKSECFRILTALKDGAISGRVTIRYERSLIHVIRVYSTQETIIFIDEEYYSEVAKGRKDGWYIHEKEI